MQCVHSPDSKRIAMELIVSAVKSTMIYHDKIANRIRVLFWKMELEESLFQEVIQILNELGYDMDSNHNHLTGELL